MSKQETLPTWDLDHFFTGDDDPALATAIDGIVPAAQAFADRWRGRLADADAKTLLAAVQAYEAAHRAPLAAYGYAHLKFAADSESAENMALIQRVRERANEAHRLLLFFPLKLDAMEDERFDALIVDPLLADYAHHLIESRKQKPHRLTEPEESILTLKTLSGRTAFVQLYSRLTSSFRFENPVQGEKNELTGSEVLALMKHADGEVRRAALETYAEKYDQNQVAISGVWNALALDHRQDLGLRDYPDPIAPIHERNELTASVVETMMQVTRDHYGLAQRYYRWKAGIQGVEKLRSCDLISPLPGDEKTTVDFETAKGWVLDAYGAFSDRFAGIAKGFFDEGRIDAPPRPGKSGGAFCMGVAPDLPVYMLMNHTGKLRDAATLAHELGHGVHFTLASKQPLLEYSPVLPLAETASVFGELLLTQKLLAQDLDPTQRRNLVAERVEDIIATTFRQTMYTDFELKAHLKIAENPLMPDAFCALWSEHLDQLYGDSVETLDASRWAWSAIPHFIHTRFYCYAYTFGELLTLAFFRRYQEEGTAFAPRFTRFLEAGGSRRPDELVKELGYDLEDPAFWAGGYKVLEEMLEELGA